jgi:ribosome-associated protein
MQQQFRMEQQMIEINIREEDEFIKLGQALKKAGLVGSGVDAKMVIQDGLVTVNGEVEVQRGKKLHGGEVISYNGETVKVIK